MSKPIPGGRGSVKTREVTIHVPVGLRYQTAELFIDGKYEEVECVRQSIDPGKALSQTLGRTMPRTVDLPSYHPYVLPSEEEDDPRPSIAAFCDGYALTFSKVTA